METTGHQDLEGRQRYLSLAAISCWESSVMRRCVMRCLWICILAVAPGLAQSDPWRAMQMIKPGANIEVQSRGVRQRGLFRAVTEEGLSLSTGTGELSLLRTEITRVKVRKRNFARRIGIGALIGAAAGFAISFAVASGIARNEGNSANGYVVLGGAIAGIGIGSGAGALVGLLPGYDTVYDASRAARH